MITAPPTVSDHDPDRLRVAVADSPARIAQILDLQRRNHFSQLSEADQDRDGFVFVRHTVEQLAAMAQRLPQAVLLDDDEVVGYSLCMGPDMRAEIPSLVPMFEAFDRMPFRGRRLADWEYVVGGQVCVAAGWRGRGLIGRLYRATRDLLPSSVELCVTEIALRNEISRRAHYRIGFEPVDRYRDDAELWEVVAWPWRAPG
ncbi:hypothetical protein [Pseudomarimonas salicorniae]|uniref:Acetyltransferase (GNAT) family protein n=1 Tax=Pseudomarimonas salicorniae TaxID=2933270 RepID=A0ABT0GLE5_9GAMM|nr:hypothetical protein [Lysobacter sp. CAU 1642]MCK7595358.1 hypothetical protein [Lysobacter sp. CAU 1642]